MGDYQTEELLTNPFSEMELELTRNEALFLDDSFTLMIENEIPIDGQRGYVSSLRPVQQTAGLSVPMDLVEKIGRAIIFTNDPNNGENTYRINIDHSELYMIREVASSFIKIGEEPVGFSLKLKVAKLLFGEDLEQEQQNKIVSRLIEGIEGLETPEPVPKSDEPETE